MANRKQLTRLFAIIEKLRYGKEATFNEIKDYLERKSEITGESLDISIRTLQRDIQDIASLFDIVIKNNTEHKYYIDFEGFNEMQHHILEAFDMLNSLKIKNDLSGFMFPERHGGGTEHIFGLIHAIKNKLVIRLTHQKFWEDEPTERKLQPLGLKEFRGRWYLLGRENEQGTVKAFGLDRIIGFDITREKFTVPKNFSANEVFRPCFGIVMPDENEDPETVILSFNSFKGKYIKSLPLHSSQEILSDNSEELRIQLRLYITHDFIRELLSHTGEIKVIEPKWLKEELKRVIKEGLKEI